MTDPFSILINPDGVIAYFRAHSRSWDWLAAEFCFTDENGRRLDGEALRSWYERQEVASRASLAV
jgi:hypothetical protein